jgi:anion-transporting  ArsA/GET3 family ATPase
MKKTVKDAYSEILRLRNEFYQKWQETSQYDDNRGAYKAKYEAFDKALELLTPSIVDSQPEETVSEDMEKAAKVYEQTRNDLDVVSDNQMVERAFQAGAKWQRQQLMKKAIEGIVTTNIDGWINVMTGFIRPEEAGANFGNKVKLIIIKEDKS